VLMMQLSRLIWGWLMLGYWYYCYCC